MRFRSRPALLEQPFGLRLACWRHGVFRGRGRELRSAHCRRPARMAGAPGPTQLKEPHMRYIIALYEIDRAYGGAEEGGWWYDTGELARLLALAPTEARAIQLADRANRLLERLQIGRAHVCTPVTNAHPVCRLPL